MIANISYRNYLINISHWYAKFVLHRCNSKIKQKAWSVIIGGDQFIARSLENNMWPSTITKKYVRTKISTVRPGIFVSDEIELTHSDYMKALEVSVPETRMLSSTIYKTSYDENNIIVEKFDYDLDGLIILSIEMDDLYMEPKIPPYLDLVREITSEVRYLDNNLSQVKVKINDLI